MANEEQYANIMLLLMANIAEQIQRIIFDSRKSFHEIKRDLTKGARPFQVQENR